MTPAPPSFLCAGAAHWDIIGQTSHALLPGADVPGRVSRRPGGVAQNVARALAALGHPAVLLAAIGRDPEGAALAADLSAAGVDCAGLHRHDGPTDRYLGIEGPTGALHAAVADCAGLERAGLALLAPLRDGRLPSPWPGTLVLDGNLPPATLGAFLEVPAAALALVPASPAKAARLAPCLAARPAALYLNRREAEALAGRPFGDTRSAAAAL
ncbi:MAG TPA: PfkB family carbohydrate kinase, partial [Amaricoccus sp.]|uniref:PfkB family carbohydrate kinase n=2 Tax=Amaricoccus TaxID=56999 RepID=UPI002B729EC7